MRTPPVKSGRKRVLSLPLMFMVLKAGPSIKPPPRRWAKREGNITNDSKNKNISRL
jgi:hypothetical protein